MLEGDKKRKEDEALEKEFKRDIKIKTIGNYVHDSVPVSDNEVRPNQRVTSKAIRGLTPRAG